MWGRWRKRVVDTATSFQSSPATTPGPTPLESQKASSPALEPATPTSAPPEDIGDLNSQLESTPHAELVGLMLKQRQTTLRYKTRFHELMEAYKTLESECQKSQVAAVETEKKLSRKLREMSEVQELNQLAKVQMEETFSLTLEEKDEKINVVQTQVRLLKEQLTQTPTPQANEAAEAGEKEAEILKLKGKVLPLPSLPSFPLSPKF
jgi:hypothetical protein